MDDYNISMLSEAKNEYTIRLLNILAPLTIEGIKSILKEAWDLCVSNEEERKYLMTFQNFLSRVPKWNQTIIEEETKRIIEQSGCNYLEDLITCVHITQLKVLTSIRVGMKQKKIELDIPKLPDFIHKVYILFARKIYSNVYLFDKNLSPIQYQKSMRECEQLCRECILDAIRISMPVENILRSYIDNTVEEEIIEETIEETDASENVVQEKDDKSSKTKEITITKNDETVKVDTAPKEETPIKEAEPVVEETEPVVKEAEPVVKEVEPIVDELVAAVVKEAEPVVEKVETPLTPKSKGLSFSDTDTEYNAETKQKTDVLAPKTIERLEKIAAIRHEERKKEEEEDDDEKLTIFRDQPDIHLGDLDIQVLDNTRKLNTDPILNDIELLS